MRIFVASSVREFEVERRQIAEYFETLNQAHERDGVRVEWYRPETMSRALVRGGSQLPYNEKITECRFFVLLIGRKLGKHTEEEFDLALKRFRETGTPLIIPYFLNVRADMDALRFQERLRKELDIEEQYIDAYDNLDVVLNHLHIELIRAGAFRREDAEQSDREAAADKGLDGIRELIREQEKRIAELNAQDVTPLIIREKTAAYEEIQRLSQKYDMPPDTLLDYLGFLWKQNLCDEGIELGQWLKRFYALHNPGEAKLGRLKNEIAICYMKSGHYHIAEQYFRETFEIFSHLTELNPAAFEPYVAHSCANLGELLRITDRKEEAESLFRKALEIHGRLAETNPSEFEPYLAHSLNNLAALLYQTDRMEEAERNYRKALEIRRRLTKMNPAEFASDLANTLNNLSVLLTSMQRMEEAERNYREALEIRERLALVNPAAFEPDLALSYNNLSVLLYQINRIEEAEWHCRKALEIRRQLVQTNPAAFEVDLAQSCYNFGVFKRDMGNHKAARQHFEEALSVYEKFQYLEKDAQDCRYQISLLKFIMIKNAHGLPPP